MPPPFNFQDSRPVQPTQRFSVSSSLLGVFGRRRDIHGSSSTVSTPTGAAPASRSYLDTPPNAERYPLSRGLTEPSNASILTQERDEPRNEHDAFIGGPSGFKELVEQLSPDRSTKERIKAARSLNDQIRDYKIDNAQSLWSNAADMLGQPTQSDPHGAALALLKTCIQNAALFQSEKRLYFDLISRHLTQSIVESVDCTRLLTQDCKAFEGLDLQRVAKSYTKWLRTAWESTDAARRKIRKDNSGSSSQEYASFWAVMDLIGVSIKYGAQMFDAHLETVLEQVLAICKKTKEESDLEQCLQVVDIIIVYASLPLTSMALLVDVICAMHSGNAEIKRRTKGTLWTLLGTHHGHGVLDHMYTILQAYPTLEARDNFATATTRGAVELFGQILVDSEHHHGVIKLNRLLPDLALALKVLDKTLEFEALRLLCGLLKQELYIEAIFTDDIWLGFSKALQRCATGRNATGLQSPSASTVSLTGPSLHATNASPRFLEVFRDIAQQLSRHAAPAADQLSDDLQDAPAIDPDRARSILTLLLSVSVHLEDEMTSAILKYINEERLHVSPEPGWMEACNDLRSFVLENPKRPKELRLSALHMLKESYHTAFAFGMRESHSVLTSLLMSINIETDPLVLQELVEIIVDVAAFTDDADLFVAVVEHLRGALLSQTTDTVPSQDLTSLRVLGTSPHVNGSTTPADTASVKVAKGLVRLFLRTIHRSFTKANRLYETLLSIARSPDPPTDARIIALKVLVRLRADINHGIFVVARTESEGLAAALCRTADSAVLAHIHDSPVVRPVKVEDTPKRRGQSGTGSSSLSRSNSGAGRSIHPPSRMNQPTPPLWIYPGPKGLPEDPHLYASTAAFSYLDQFGGGDEIAASRRGVIDIGKWMEVILELITSKDTDWEIFSYVIVHLGGQLSNHALFAATIPHIKDLRRVICDQLMRKTCIDPPSFTNLKKSDVAVCLYHTLIMLISYRGHFQKDEEQDPIVKALVFGIGSWERTSETCIHGLSICCHEMPILLVRYLDNALQKMTQIITQSNMAASILDFFATLARLPALFRNFGEDNFKNVFGICFRYLQYVRDQRSRQTDNSDNRMGRPKEPATARSSRDLASSVGSIKTTGGSLGEALPQYVYAFTFHCMTFWFMALKLQDRQKHIGWIIQNLKYKDVQGEDVLDEMAEVTIDMMHRVANSDRDETAPQQDFAKPGDGMVSSKDYLWGNSIMTVDTAGRSGLTQITYRRPSGTSYWRCAPMIIEPPRHQAPITIGLAADTYLDSDYVGITPDHIVQNMYSHLIANASLVSGATALVTLPEDDATRRTIGVFDRTPALDGHKVGIIYVGERQTEEAVILANVMGSADYMAFLNKIGTLTQLKGATINTQGLDHEFESDGKFTYCWRDRVTELVFHIPTMMPTNLEHDPQCSQKKRHIGNDFVNIIFNNSGLPFDVNTFPSDFNYVNIVITPEARASFVETRMYHMQRQQQEEELQEEIFYKVTVMTKEGLPEISPASEARIISGGSLPTFVRLLALNASVFCQVWANRDSGEYPSSWRKRLNEIKRLREKHAPIASELANVKSPQSNAAMSPPPTASTNDNLVSRANSILRRSSAMFTDGSQHSANRHSLASVSAGDVDQTSSTGSQDR